MMHPGLELSLFGSKTEVAAPSPGLFHLIWRLHPAASPHAPPNRAAARSAHTAPPNSNPLFLTTSSSVLTRAVPLLLSTHATLQETALPPSSGCLWPGVPCILEGIPLFPYNFPSPHPKPLASSPAPQAVLTHTSQEQHRICLLPTSATLQPSHFCPLGTVR